MTSEEYWRYLRELMNPPWLEEARRVARLRDEIDRASRYADEARLEHDRFYAQARLQEKVQSMGRLQDNIALGQHQTYAHIARLAVEAERARRQYDELARTLRLDELARGYAAIRAIVPDYLELQRALFQEQLAWDSELLDVLAHPEQASTQAIERAFDSVVESLQMMADRYPRSWLTFRTLVLVVFTILLPLYAAIERRIDKAENAAFREKHDARIEQLQGQVQALKPTTEGKLYVTTRAVVLRSEPDSGSHAIARIPGSSFIELVDVSDKWAWVSHFDYETEELTEGWVYFPALREVE